MKWVEYDDKYEYQDENVPKEDNEHPSILSIKVNRCDEVASEFSSWLEHNERDQGQPLYLETSRFTSTALKLSFSKLTESLLQEFSNLKRVLI